MAHTNKVKMMRLGAGVAGSDGEEDEYEENLRNCESHGGDSLSITSCSSNSSYTVETDSTYNGKRGADGKDLPVDVLELMKRK